MSTSANADLRRILESLARHQSSCKCAIALTRGGGDTHCPGPGHSHDDTSPSLTVHEKDGKVLLNCKGGCSQSDVIDALRKRGLWSATREPNEEPPRVIRTITYRILDEQSVLQALHKRVEYSDGTKDFKWASPDGTSGLKGRKVETLPLYGAERLSSQPGERVVIVEGEKCAVALVKVGVLAVGTVTGAKKEPGLDALRCLLGREVLLWPDNDRDGISHMNRVARNLVQLGITPRIIRWAAAPPKGDAAIFVQRVQAA